MTDHYGQLCREYEHQIDCLNNRARLDGEAYQLQEKLLDSLLHSIKQLLRYCDDSPKSLHRQLTQLVEECEDLRSLPDHELKSVL